MFLRERDVMQGKQSFVSDNHYEFRRYYLSNPHYWSQPTLADDISLLPFLYKNKIPSFRPLQSNDDTLGYIMAHYFLVRHYARIPAVLTRQQIKRGLRLAFEASRILFHYNPILQDYSVVERYFICIPFINYAEPRQLQQLQSLIERWMIEIEHPVYQELYHITLTVLNNSLSGTLSNSTSSSDDSTYFTSSREYIIDYDSS